MTNRPITDTHVHLWDRSQMKVSWTEGAGKFDRDFVLEDYSQEMKEHAIDSVLYMEVNADEDSKEEELSFVKSLYEDPTNPLKGAVLNANPLALDFESQIKAFKQYDFVKGIRQVLHLDDQDQGICLDPTFQQSMSLLAKHQLTFDVCVRADEMADVVMLAQTCSETRLVIDHCGCINPSTFDFQNPEGIGWDVWKKSINDLSRLPNVWIKLSGLLPMCSTDYAQEECSRIIKVILESFETDRIIIGSDFPLCMRDDQQGLWFQVLDQIIDTFSEEIKTKIYQTNALNLYKI